MTWIKISIASLFGLILLATAALAIAGLGADANRLQCSMVIRQSPAVIWPWLYQSDKVTQWVSWLVEARIDGPPDPVPGLKAVWVMEDRNNGNQRMEIASVVNAAEPPHRLAVTVSAPMGFHGTSVYTLTGRADGSTLVGSDSRYVFDNAFARFMTPLVLWQAKKKMLSDLDHMRTLLEGRP